MVKLGSITKDENKKKKDSYYGIVTCPIYKKTYELDGDKGICPCCGDIHDLSCYDFSPIEV